MKNLIKKLGIIAIAIAILIPFVELPRVNAAEDGCEIHLQNYMFLDITYNTTQTCNNLGGCIFGQYIEPDDTGEVPGYTTYGLFAYKFSDVKNKTIEYVTVDYNYLNDQTALTQYWALHNGVMNLSSTTNSYWNDNIGQLGATFVDRNTPNYDTNTVILHGKWASENAQNDPNSYNDTQISEWSDSTYNRGKSIQSLGISNTQAKQKMIITMDGATYNGTRFATNTAVSWSQQNPGDYFKKILTGENTEGVYTDPETGYKYIPLKINRKFEADALENITFGGSIGDKYYVYSTTIPTTDSDKTVAKASNSYEAFKAYKNAEALNAKGQLTDENLNKKFNEVAYEITKTDFDNNIDINIGGRIYWPFVMNVEYKLCSNTTEDWSIKYDDNVGDNSVNNMPDSLTVKEKVGTDIKLSTTKPTRKDYAFEKWCDDKDGKGSCYKPGDTVESPDAAKTITLYAIWKDTTAGTQKPYGVSSYIIGFAAVGLVAGGIYLISKKKNLFKQI